MKNQGQELNRAEISRVIEMAWDDLTPFEAISSQYGLSEAQVIRLMRQEMKISSFRMWRKRVSGRPAKHEKISRLPDVTFENLPGDS